MEKYGVMAFFIKMIKTLQKFLWISWKHVLRCLLQNPSNVIWTFTKQEIPVFDQIMEIMKKCQCLEIHFELFKS